MRIWCPIRNKLPSATRISGSTLPFRRWTSNVYEAIVLFTTVSLIFQHENEITIRGNCKIQKMRLISLISYSAKYLKSEFCNYLYPKIFLKFHLKPLDNLNGRWYDSLCKGKFCLRLDSRRRFRMTHSTSILFRQRPRLAAALVLILPPPLCYFSQSWDASHRPFQ